MKTAKPAAINQLLFAKYLLSRARKLQSERGELGVAVSLLMMHDAAETVMVASTAHLGISKAFGFMEFWETVKTTGFKEPAFKRPLDTLNTMRVNLKHKGIRPHSQSVRDLLPTVEAFCAEATQLYFDDLDFNTLGLEQLVASEGVRKTLTEARKAFDEGNLQDAFISLGIAFDTLFREVSKDAPLIDSPPPFRITERQLPKEHRDKITKLVDTVGQSARTLNVLMLGIDPVRYRSFLNNTPRMSRALSGQYQSVFHPNVGRTETFDTCFDFVVESALTLAEVFRADDS